MSVWNRVVGAATAVGFALGAQPPAAALPAAPDRALPGYVAEVVPDPCTEVVVSPTFAQDGHAFCAGEVVGSEGKVTAVAIHATTDGGRTWRRSTAGGLVFVPEVPRLVLRGAFVSPEYGRDRSFYVALHSTGLFVSRDGGEVFVPVDTTAGYGRPTSFRIGIEGVAHAAFLKAWSSGVDGSNRSTLVVPSVGGPVPVKGSPGRDVEFAVSPAYPTDGTALVVADEGVGLTARTTIYACNAAFECSTPRYTLPPGRRFGRLWFTGASSAGLLVLSLIDDRGIPTLWRSSDAARSFVRWSAAERLLRGYRFPPMYGLAFTEGRIYLRTSAAGWIDPPAEQLFVSSNGGRTFRRVSWGREPQDGPPGPMPVNTPYGPTGERDTVRTFVVSPRAGTVLMVGFGPNTPAGKWSVYCTTDEGRAWHRTCRSRT